MDNRQTRRKYLLALGATSAVGLAGCSQGNSTQQQTATEAPTSNLGGANFAFEYAASDQQVVIEFNGGAGILAGDLQVRSSTGVQAEWAELGSSVASPGERISTGATAILGPNILNWEQPVGRDETIRLVHVGQETPATLGRFTPPESSTLTSTVPLTDAPTEEPIEAPTETPTEELDTTAPSITAFSISNPSGQDLRTSFDSDERLSTIQVTVSGAETTVLTTDDFSETSSGGAYSYEATYQASSDGDYTATLDEAADASDNDGASGQSVSLSVSTSEVLYEYTWESGTLGDWEKTSVQYGSYTDTFEIVQNDPISDDYSPQTEVLNDRIGVENTDLSQELEDTTVSSVSGQFRIEGDLDANFVNFNGFSLGPGRVVFYHQDREIRWNNGGAPDSQENPTVLASFTPGEVYDITISINDESFSASVNGSETENLAPADGESAEVNQFYIDCRNSGGSGPSVYDGPIYFAWDNIEIYS
jgi:hypothetical protein